MDIYKLFTDGGARGNPGPAGIGYVIIKNGKIIKFDARFIGNSTNNKAEYKALLFGLENGLREKIENIRCYIDSELVVKQLNGVYKIKDAKLKSIAKKINKKSKNFKTIEFIHIMREKNSFADKLANIAMDAHQN